MNWRRKFWTIWRNFSLSKSFKLCLILCYMKPWNGPRSHHFASRQKKSQTPPLSRMMVCTLLSLSYAPEMTYIYLFLWNDIHILISIKWHIYHSSVKWHTYTYFRQMTYIYLVPSNDIHIVSSVKWHTYT